MERQKYELAETDYMKGMKYKDIAEKYSVTINTVKSWKKRYSWDRKGCTQKEKRVHTKKGHNESTLEEVDFVIKNSKLTDKQRLFCIYYAKLFNATKAYQKAYDVDYATAASIGYRMLENVGVKNEILRLKQNRLNREFLSAEDIFQKYMDIAFSDIADYVEFGQTEVQVMAMYGPVFETNPKTGEKVPVTEIVNTVSLKESNKVDGSLIQEISNGKNGAKIKLMDKQKALDWLANHIGLATDEQKARIENIKANTAKIKGEEYNAVEEDDGFINALKGEIGIWEK